MKNLSPSLLLFGALFLSTALGACNEDQNKIFPFLLPSAEVWAFAVDEDNGNMLISLRSSFYGPLGNSLQLRDPLGKVLWNKNMVFTNSHYAFPVDAQYEKTITRLRTETSSPR